MIEKLRQLIRVYYQLGSNRVDELKALQEKWAFFNPNLHKIYNLTISNKR